MVLDDQMCLEKENSENSLSIKLSCVAKELKSGVRCLIRQISGLPLNFREVWKLRLLVLCLVATAPIRQNLQLLLWGQTHSQSILQIYSSVVSWEDYSVRFNPFLIKHLKYTSWPCMPSVSGRGQITINIYNLGTQVSLQQACEANTHTEIAKCCSVDSIS